MTTLLLILAALTLAAMVLAVCFMWRDLGDKEE